MQHLFTKALDATHSPGTVKVLVDCLLGHVQQQACPRTISVSSGAFVEIVESLIKLCSMPQGKECMYAIAVTIPALDRYLDAPPGKSRLLKDKCAALLSKEIEKVGSLSAEDKRPGRRK